MLKSLYIKNMAIIDELNIEFKSGLNIITGETGAGKTLLIKALQLLLGEKFSKEMLRTGNDQLVVEGFFNNNGENKRIRRIYNKTGKSRNYLNDDPIKKSELAQLTKALIDLHGQHEHQNLLDTGTHLKYLDSFGDYKIELEKLQDTYKDRELKQIELNGLLNEQKQIEEKTELYKFQFQELSQHELNETIECETNKQFEIQSRAAEIKEKLLEICSLTFQSDNSVINSLNKSKRILDSLTDSIESIQIIANRIESSRIELEDIVNEILSLENSIKVSPAELEKCEKLLSYFEEMKRKYGGTLKAAIRYRDEINTTLENADHSTNSMNRLQNEINTITELLQKISNVVSVKRLRTAKKLETDIQWNLKHLNMPSIQFKINLSSDINKMTSDGQDECEFLISTNIGEELRPVSKIASGGEISRIMLAIKMALQSRDMVDTLIFDEIDAGISGQTADKVGDTIQKLSESHQIICITHLPQIAGKGNCHFNVTKEIKNNRVITTVNSLNPDDRILELAALISGSNLTVSSKEQAAELLKTNG